MSQPPPPDRVALGRARLAARARRISVIRRRVVAATLATFALAWGAVVYDGSMGTSATATAQVTTPTTTTSTTTAATPTATSTTTAATPTATATATPTAAATTSSSSDNSGSTLTTSQS